MAPTTKATGKAAKAPTKASDKAARATTAAAKGAKGAAAGDGAKKAATQAEKRTKAAAEPTKKPTSKTTAKAPQAKPPAKKAGRVIPALAKRVEVDGKKPPPRRKGPLDKFLLGQLEALEKERETYTRQAASLREEADLLAAEREPGDVQFDDESGEGDTLAVERERDLALSAQASAAVEEIDRAIQKIKDGTYGVCEECYSPIPKDRLRALPYAALCVHCKSAGFATRR